MFVKIFVMVFLGATTEVLSGGTGSVIYTVTNTLNKHLVFKYFMYKPNHFKSLVISPLSVKLSLSMLASVATGRSKLELMAVLGFDKDSKTTYFHADTAAALDLMKLSDLLLLNSIFIDTKFSLNPALKTNCSLNYGVQVDRVGYEYRSAALAFINRYIESLTLRRIEEMLEDSDVTENTSMIIINAAHFKSTWERPFSMSRSKIDKFICQNGTMVTVPMMIVSAEFQAVLDRVPYKLVTMFLKEWGGSVTIIVPSESATVQSLLMNLRNDSDYFKEAIRSAKYSPVNVKMPRIKFKTVIDMSMFLKQVGLKQIFEPNESGLDGLLNVNITKTTGIPFVGTFKQKNFIDIDESGVFRSGFVRGYRGEILNEPINAPRGYLKTHSFDDRDVIADSQGDVFANKPFIFMVNVLGGLVGGPGPAVGLKGDHPNPPPIHNLFFGVYYGP